MDSHEPRQSIDATKYKGLISSFLYNVSLFSPISLPFVCISTYV